MRFLAHFVVFVVFSLLVWTGLVFAQANHPTKMSQWIYDAYEKKSSISLKIKEKKMIIMAGSNALFGINSTLLSEAFNLNVVNYGVNAGIELPYTLHIAKDVIKKGDILLVPLEYPMYSYDGRPGAQMIDYIFSRDASFFWELSLQEQFYMLWHIDVKRVWDGYFDQSTQSVTQGLYGAHHIDRNGDQINTSVEDRPDWMFDDVKNNFALTPENYGAAFDGDALGWEYLEKFTSWCKGMDVQVVFIPSTLLKHNHYLDNKRERWFYENIGSEVRKRGWSFVGDPYTYMYKTEDYFNTNFHLIDKARDRRTRQIIEDLKKASILN